MACVPQYTKQVQIIIDNDHYNHMSGLNRSRVVFIVSSLLVCYTMYTGT